MMKKLLLTTSIMLSSTTLANNDDVTVVINQFKKSAIGEYWTTERLINAINVETIIVDDKEFRQQMNMNRDKSTDGVAEQSIIIEGEYFDTDTADTPIQADVKKRPFWNGGKLFFTKPNGKDYVCSGQFMGEKNIILTAAHCVVDGKTGASYKNFVFYRGYSNGGGQQVKMNCARVPKKWDKPRNFAYDYAFFNTQVESSAGAMGLKTLLPYTSWTAIGYPKNYGNTQYMYKVEGTKGTVKNGIVQMKNNPMGGGSSGGAWIGDLSQSRAKANYVIGVNSFGYDSEPNVTYGPYLDSEFYKGYEETIKGCK